MSVAELQARSTPAEQASVSAIQARAAAEAQARRVPPVELAEVDEDTDTESLRSEDDSDEQGTSHRLARSIVVTMMAMLVLGAVTAGAVLGGGRPHRLSPSAPAVQPTMISGPAVVRPDVIIRRLTTGAVDVAPPDVVPPGSPDAATSEHPIGLLADRTSAAQLVSSFYGALPLRPAEAFALLAPSMQADGWMAFESGWRGIRSVQSRLLPRQDDEVGVRVLVSIERLDGTLLRLLQRVEVRTIAVANTPQLRIVSVQLLSAHRV